jgi:hypothetical protein
VTEPVLPLPGGTITFNVDSNSPNTAVSGQLTVSDSNIASAPATEPLGVNPKTNAKGQASFSYSVSSTATPGMDIEINLTIGAQKCSDEITVFSLDGT